MACFLVPTAEAIIVTAINQGVKGKEKNESALSISSEEEAFVAESEKEIPLSRKLAWLKNMLWGGAALLAFEHVWHGEVVPWFPFLTAAADPADAADMLHEMATSGVMMAVLVTVIWAVMVGVTNSITKRSTDPEVSNN